MCARRSPARLAAMRLTMLRLNADVVDRVHAWADEHELSLPEAASRLLTAGLDHLSARAAGGQARTDAMSTEERSDLGRRAAAARWQKR